MERLWLVRLRWRVRGAWMWPTFALATVGEALLAHELPPSGDAASFVPALLVCGFLNLAVVAVLAPLCGLLLRRRRPDLPRIVATDYAGTALLVTAATAIATAGVLHHPSVVAQQHALRAQAVAARSYVLSSAPARFRARLGAATTLRLEQHLFRTCVPDVRPERAFCMLIATDRLPPAVREDPDREPNSVYRHGL